MSMKSFTIKYRDFIKYLFIAFIAILFIFPATGFAQKRVTEKKGKAKKTTRVFYGQASFYSNKFNGRRTANG